MVLGEKVRGASMGDMNKRVVGFMVVFRGDGD
jgi:hypothetical protein